jgi:hypothetical protein
LHNISSRAIVARVALHSALNQLENAIAKISVTHVMNNSASSCMEVFQKSKDLGVTVFAREEEHQLAMTCLRDFVHDALCRIRYSSEAGTEFKMLMHKNAMLEQAVRDGVRDIGGGGGFEAGKWVECKRQRLANMKQEQFDLEMLVEQMLHYLE